MTERYELPDGERQNRHPVLTAQAPLWQKLISVFGVAILVYITVPLPTSAVLELWINAFLLGRVILVGGLSLFVAGLLSSFLTRTKFFRDHLSHRTLSGLTRVIAYAEVTDLRYDGDRLRIVSRDGRVVDVWRATGDVHRIAQIVRAGQARSR